MSGAGHGRQSGWRAALACMVALAVAMGLGRFAFTPMLPLMLHAQWIDLAQGGVLASLNYLGYFVGALSAAAVLRWPATLVLRASLVATVVLLAAMGVLAGVPAWGVVRLAAGVMSAWAFVAASSWGMRRLAEAGRPALGGVIYAGPGVGIVASGLVVSAASGAGTTVAWIALAALAAVSVAAIWPAIRDGDAAPGLAAAPLAASGASAAARWLIALYGLAGFGYIITATFLPVIARQALPGSPWPDLFWPLFGLAIVPGALIGARMPQRWDNRHLLAGAYAMQALGVALSVAWPRLPGLALGSLLAGLPFTAITLFAVREARRLRGDAAGPLIGWATASYGLGQIAGPLFAAPLAQRTGSFALPLWTAAGVLALGALLFLWTGRRP